MYRKKIRFCIVVACMIGIVLIWPASSVETALEVEVRDSEILFARSIQSRYSSSSDKASVIYPTYPYPILGCNPQRTNYVDSPAPNNATPLWQTGYLGAGPITVADGRILFTGFNYSEMWLFQIYSLNQSDGTMIWRRTQRWRGDWPPYPLPSLTVYGYRIFYTHRGTLYCLDESSGWVIWESSPTPIDLSRGLSDSPVADDSRVFLVAGDEEREVYLFAFNITNGETLWSVHLKGGASSPAVIDDMVLINSYNSTSRVAYIESFNKEDGRQLWSRRVEGVGSNLPPSVSYGKVFVGLGPSVYALNQTAGNILWNYTAQGNVITTPAIAYGKVFAASTDGYLYSLDEATGSVIWRYPIINMVWNSLGCIAIADNKVFVATGNPAVLYALNETNGELIWFHNIGYWVWSLCIADGNLFVSADGIVYVFGECIVTTQPSISLQINPPQTAFGLPVNISGSINPERNGTVCIQWSINKEVWYSLNVAAFNGLYHYVWIPPCSGKIYIKASWEGDQVYSGGTSAIETVTVFLDEQEMKLYSELFAEYNKFRADYYSLKTDYDTLETEYESTIRELQIKIGELTTNTTLTYLFVITTIIFIATTVFFAKQKRAIYGRRELIYS